MLAAAVAVACFSFNAANPERPASSATTPTSITSAASVTAISSLGVGEETVDSPRGRPVSEVISEAKSTDLQAFNRRLRTLRNSPEFTSFLTAQAGSPEAGGIEGLAAALTDEQAHAFVKAIKGKAFAVSYDIQGKETVRLTSSASHPNRGDVKSAGLVINQSGTSAIENAAWTPPSCWQGWFAAAGYQAATGAICGSLGAMSFGLAGAACGAVAWTAGMGINWNDACR
jgi:hypothetical protein